MEFKSKLVKCPRGHYYNSVLHDQCPVCQEEGADNPDAAVGGTIPVGDTDAGQNVPGGTIPVGDSGQGGSFPATAPVDNASIGGVFDGKTIIGEDMPIDANIDPVVGWLVCIEGNAMGRDFQIHMGYNYIGREDGDICIPGDMHISRQNHAMIAYDPSDDIYYVGPSAGRNLIKLNGKTIFGAAEIKSYDVLSIGATKLMFIGLCGEQFNWGRGKENV